MNGHLISLLPRGGIHGRAVRAGLEHRDPHPSLSLGVPTLICQALTGALVGGTGVTTGLFVL